MSETLATTLVERLEAVGCDREPFTDAHKHCICRLTNEAAREISKLKSQLETLRGAMKADDERLRAAGLRSDCYAGCDTPEAIADNIELLKSQLEEARAAMQVVLDDPALQSVAGWYDSINGLRSVLDAHKEGGKS